MYKFMRRSCNEGGAEEEREEETPASILILVSVTRPLFNGLFKSSILSYYSIHLVYTLEKNTHFGNFTSSKDFIWIPWVPRDGNTGVGGGGGDLGSWEIHFHLLMDARAGKEVLFIWSHLAVYLRSRRQDSLIRFLYKEASRAPER